jgi:hypothetical protein
VPGSAPLAGRALPGGARVSLRRRKTICSRQYLKVCRRRGRCRGEREPGDGPTPARRRLLSQSPSRSRTPEFSDGRGEARVADGQGVAGWKFEGCEGGFEGVEEEGCEGGFEGVEEEGVEGGFQGVQRKSGNAFKRAPDGHPGDLHIKVAKEVCIVFAASRYITLETPIYFGQNYQNYMATVWLVTPTFCSCPGPFVAPVHALDSSAEAHVGSPSSLATSARSVGAQRAL